MDFSSEGHKRVYEKIEELVKPGFKILDVGCGDGSFLDKVSNTYDISGVGIDPSPTEEGTDTNCRILRAESIGGLGEKFDIIYSTNSLHHFEDVSEFFESVPKRLERSGRVILADWKKGATTDIPESYYSREHITSLLTKAGIEVEESQDLKKQFILIGSLI